MAEHVQALSPMVHAVRGDVGEHAAAGECVALAVALAGDDMDFSISDCDRTMLERNKIKGAGAEDGGRLRGKGGGGGYAKLKRYSTRSLSITSVWLRSRIGNGFSGSIVFH